MLKLKNKGGEMAKEGTKWKLPAAIAPTLALILVGVLPGYLSSLYGAFTDKLVTAYIAFGCMFIVLVVGGLSIMFFHDRAALSRSMKVFRFRPAKPVSEAEDLAGTKLRAIRIDEE